MLKSCTTQQASHSGSGQGYFSARTRVCASSRGLSATAELVVCLIICVHYNYRIHLFLADISNADLLDTQIQPTLNSNVYHVCTVT